MFKLLLELIITSIDQEQVASALLKFILSLTITQVLTKWTSMHYYLKRDVSYKPVR